MVGTAPAAEATPSVDVKILHAKIGELTLENDAPQGLRGSTGATIPAPISAAPGKTGLASERKAMIDRSHRLGLVRQAGALWISRGSLHYLSPPGLGDRSRIRHCLWTDGATRLIVLDL